MHKHISTRIAAKREEKKWRNHNTGVRSRLVDAVLITV